MSNTRWNTILEHLRAQIESGAKKPGDKMLSEIEIAAEWQVCRMTAHRAMSELTREGWVVRKRRAGTIVASRSKSAGARMVQNVALLCFHSSDFPQASYVHGFRAGMSEDHHVLLCDSRNDAACEAAYLHRLQEQADAICVFPTCAPENDVLLQAIAASGKPLIFLDRVPDCLSTDADGIVTDNFASTKEAIHQLITRGHRRIAHFTTDNPAVAAVRERLDGYAAAMQEANVTDWKSQARIFPRCAGYAFDAFAEAIRETLEDMLSHPEPPTAIFCLEDYFLAAVIEACEKLELIVPRDIEIISFNDCPPLLPRPDLRIHRIVQQAYAMGHLAAERLQRQMDGEAMPVSQIQRIPAHIYLLDANKGSKAVLSASVTNPARENKTV